jgi:hypothetical protein
MENNILIAGAGQLGSRYLQGLSRFVRPLNIWVYDISFFSLECARKRWEECSGNLHRVAYIQDLSDIPTKIDMACVATNSDVRLEVVKKITQIASVRYWILEKVLARTVAELNYQAEVTTGSSGVWVNTPMYLMPLYRAFRGNIIGGSPIHASFTGMRGLACNAIHYIDFVSRWNQGRITSIETSGLNRIWVPAKRAGFFEAEGELFVRFSDGSTLLISGNSKAQCYRVEISIDDDIWNVDENKGLAQTSCGKIISGAILRQSELTAPLLDEIFTFGRCNLPTLEMSIAQHEPLLKALLAHWNANMQEKLDYVPIT